jgi:hypothetical protein
VSPKRREGAAVSVAFVVGGAFVLMHCASLEGLADRSADASSSPSPSGNDGASSEGTVVGMPGATDATDATDATVLGPGEILCGSTMTACDVRSAQCCVTLSGTSSRAARSYSTSSARCGPIDGPGCGQVIVAGTDFTMQFPQRCATATDCAVAESCCVLPIDPTNRFGKELSGIKCIAATQCATKGRAICRGASDCAATENCLAETDPVLSHLYAKFCQ